MLGASRQPLPGDPPGNPQPYAQYAPNTLRFHFVMMVAVTLADGKGGTC
jgi:hypothetical protein